jgi:hypothetical protein
VFFIGSTRRFGWWAIASVITIWAGSYITNYFTKTLVSRPKIARRLASNDQSGAVLLALFIDKTNKGYATASLVRLITLTNILAILWLEFAVFSDIAWKLGFFAIFSEMQSPEAVLTGIYWGTLILFVCAFAVIYFTLRYGLRGFTFATLLHAPIILVGTVVLLIGAIAFLLGSAPDRVAEATLPGLLSGVVTTMNAPLTDVLSGLLFVGSCIFLNSFLMLVTQPHWLRVWMFGEKETSLQVASLSITAIVWLILILIGALASVVAGMAPNAQPSMNEITTIGLDLPKHVQQADEVTVYFLTEVTKTNPLYTVAFWLAGTAALFSTAAAHIYSFFLIIEFNLREGKLSRSEMKQGRLILYAAIAAALFAGCYALVRFLNVQFDQLVLVLLPSCLNIVPALILAVRGIQQEPVLLRASITLYSIFAFLALLPHKLASVFFPHELASVFPVAAPLMPLLFSIIALVYRRKGLPASP